MTRLKRCLICIMVALMVSCVVAGCNTVEGAGRDIEAGGEAIQDAAD